MKILKKIQTETIFLEHKFSNGIVYRETRINGKFSDSYFLRPYPSIKNKIYKDHTYLHMPKILELSKKCTWEEIINKVCDKDWSAKQIDVERFDDFENVIYFGGNIDGMTWRILNDFPMSTPIYQDYIGGYSNKNWNLNNLYEYLKTRPEIKEVKFVDIPYCNSDDGVSTKAVEFLCILPQSVYAALFNKYKNDKFWSCKITDALHSYTEDDPLGIKSKPELKNTR